MRCQDNFERMCLWHRSILFLGRIGRASMRHSISEREDFSFSLRISLSNSKLKSRPRYLKDSPDLTVGTSSVLINNFGSYWRDR